MIMTKQKLMKLSLVCLIIGAVVLLIGYFFFHFVTDAGITFTWHPEAGKPFVTDMIGMLGVLFVWSSAMSFISSIIFFEKKEK